MTARRFFLFGMIFCAPLLVACAQPVAGPASAQAQPSILAKSDPASGATVKGPLYELKLHFNPPAQLSEVTIAGPGGVMPMMIHPAGELENYIVPLSGLNAGTYSVNWRAVARGREFRGSFSFAVRD